MNNFSIGDSVRIMYTHKYPARYYGQDRRIDNYPVTGKIGTIVSLRLTSTSGILDYLVDIDGLIFQFSFYSLEKCTNQSRILRIK